MYLWLTSYFDHSSSGLEISSEMHKKLGDLFRTFTLVSSNCGLVGRSIRYVKDLSHYCLNLNKVTKNEEMSYKHLYSLCRTWRTTVFEKMVILWPEQVRVYWPESGITMKWVLSLKWLGQNSVQIINKENREVSSHAEFTYEVIIVWFPLIQLQTGEPERPLTLMFSSLPCSIVIRTIPEESL